jgi:hypothetical protein
MFLSQLKVLVTGAVRLRRLEQMVGKDGGKLMQIQDWYP